MLFVVDTQNTDLNVRSGPGVNFSPVDTLKRGDLVIVIGAQGDWKKLAPDRWVHGDYLWPASTSENFLLPHYRWPDDPGRKMLAGFDTSKADLKPQHKQWLADYVAPRASMGQWVFLRGYASKSGNPVANKELSARRANAVKEFLTIECGVPGQKITGSGGVGEEWSGGSANDNSPKWRAVEVIVSNGVIAEPSISIGVGSPLSREFYIKYRGGGGGGPPTSIGTGPDLSVHGFVIRNPGDWYIRYAFLLIGGSLGAPFSMGSKLPPGQGWARFSTADLRTVDSFGSRAFLLSSGAQIGSIGGNFFFKLYVPDIFEVDVPTGPGFSADAIQAGWTWDLNPHPDGPRQGTNWQLE